MKRIIVLLFLCLFYSINAVYASEDSVKDTIYENSAIEDIANSDEEITEIMPAFDFDTLIRDASSGKNLFEPQTILQRIINFIFDETILYSFKPNKYSFTTNKILIKFI